MWRADTLRTKEPETLGWIDTMRPGETLVDIGANVGTYTLYAAKRGINVIAFEPESQYVKVIAKNCLYNKLSGRVIIIPEVGQKAKEHVEMADHVKIDTDGFEVDVLLANENVFRNVKSIQIEEAPDLRDEIGRILSSWGFRCISREASNMMKNSKWGEYRNAVWVRTTT